MKEDEIKKVFGKIKEKAPIHYEKLNNLDIDTDKIKNIVSELIDKKKVAVTDKLEFKIRENKEKLTEKEIKNIKK